MNTAAPPLSPTLLGLIRNDFDKLIITDSLIMRGVLDNVSTPIQAAIKAIKAGADLLLYGGESLVSTRRAHYSRPTSEKFTGASSMLSEMAPCLKSVLINRSEEFSVQKNHYNS